MATRLLTPTTGLAHGDAVVAPQVAGQATVGVVKIATEERYDEKLAAIAGRLETLAGEQVSLKAQVEQRWLDSVRAYHGRYSTDMRTKLDAAGQSTAYIKAARAKTVALEARLFDLIFPTDDRNWGIGPTPVPKLTDELKEAKTRATNAAAQATQAAQAGDAATEAQIVAAGQDEAARAKAAAEAIAKVTRASKLMQEEMDDQLVECQYPQVSRKAIHDFCQLGTAILKGPVVFEARRGRWTPGENGYTLTQSEQKRPAFRWTDPWSFFPDMSATSIEECEFTFERYLWTRSDLRKMVKTHGFNPDAVRELLRDDRSGRATTSPGLSNLVLLRSLTEDATGAIKGRFVGWEYHGPLEQDEVICILRAMERHDEADMIAAEDDPLREHRVVVWFCEGQILKIAPEYPMDSGETLYSLANLEDAEGSIFGYGVPWIMMDSGDALNAAWRMILDNGALSVGPQVIIEKDAIQPANGQWTFAPKKVWFRIKAALQGTAPPLEFFNVPNNQSEMGNVVTMAAQFIDMETGIPQPQQGEQGSHTTQTVGGMAILQNAANIIFRRIVKNWDDGIITPSMRRLYDWNMQFSEREEIKGDMQVDARGTSVLLVKEVQANNLMLIVSNLMSNPNIAPMLKAHPAVAKLFQAMMIKPDEVMMTEDEWGEYQQKMAQQPPPPNPQEILAQARIAVAEINKQVAEMKDQSMLAIAELKRETELLKLASMGELTIEELRNKLDLKRMDNDSRERVMVAEAAMEKRAAQEARARGEEPQGSGGYFSAGDGDGSNDK